MKLLSRTLPALVLWGNLANFGELTLAHVTSNRDCVSCHAASPTHFEMVDFQSTQGGLRVYQVLPGDTVPVGINVTSGAAQHAVNFYVANAAGVTNANNTLSFQPDAAWTVRTSGGTHYMVPVSGTFTSTQEKSVFNLTVAPETPPDLYRAVVQVAGKPSSGSKWGQKTEIYIEVLSSVVANHPPAVTPVADKTVAEGTPLNFLVVASDSDPGQTLTYALAGAPAGAIIEPSAGTFSWSPSEIQGPGTYPLAVVVTDSGTPPLSVTNTFQVTVTEVNVGPMPSPIPNQVVTVGSSLRFTAQAQDQDLPAQSLAYSLGAGAPPEATIQPTSGVFSWTPSSTQATGVMTLQVVVTDDGTPPQSASTDVQITVQKPVVSAPHITGLAISATAFTCSVATTPSVIYSLDCTASLDSGVWTPVSGATIVGDGTTITLSDPNVSATHRFYRVRAE